MRRLLSLFLLASTASAQAFGPPPPPEVTREPRPGTRLPDVELVDEAGESVRLHRLAGERPIVLAFVYYECPMLCDLVLDGLVRSLRALSYDAGSEFDVWAVNADSEYLEELSPEEASLAARLARTQPRPPREIDANRGRQAVLGGGFACGNRPAAVHSCESALESALGARRRQPESSRAGR